MAKVARKVPPRVFCEDGSSLLKTTLRSMVLKLVPLHYVY